jgi:hypothetical protein
LRISINRDTITSEIFIAPQIGVIKEMVTFTNQNGVEHVIDEKQLETYSLK